MQYSKTKHQKQILLANSCRHPRHQLTHLGAFVQLKNSCLYHRTSLRDPFKCMVCIDNLLLKVSSSRESAGEGPKSPWIGLVVEEWQCKLLGPYWGLLWKFHSSYSWRHVKTNHRLTTTTSTAIKPDWLNHSKPIPRGKELKHCPLSLIALDCICCRRLKLQAEFMFFERRMLWFIWEHCI